MSINFTQRFIARNGPDFPHNPVNAPFYRTPTSPMRIVPCARCGRKAYQFRTYEGGFPPGTDAFCRRDRTWKRIRMFTDKIRERDAHPIKLSTKAPPAA